MRRTQSVSIDGFTTTLSTADEATELFKAQVAARIGREPHEILLKRQGERPFKDQLTLEDYGVSNGVQLDLSVIFLHHSIQHDTDNFSERWILATEQFVHDLPEPSFVLERCCIRRHGFQQWGFDYHDTRPRFPARNRC